MLIFTFVFNKMAKLDAPPGIPYPLMVFTAMLPWQFFATALSESSNSLIGNANLNFQGVIFPGWVVPASAVITSFVDFVITMAMLAAMMVWYKFWPDWGLLAFSSVCSSWHLRRPPGLACGFARSTWISRFSLRISCRLLSSSGFTFPPSGLQATRFQPNGRLFTL